MGVCYIVGAGDFFGAVKPDSDDLVIAADGGYDKLLANGVSADVVIGDMDSVEREASGVITVRHPIEKDETDMHLAYLYGKRMGYSKFYMYGGTGGRPDHTFANYSLLFLAKKAGDSITIVDKDYDIFAVENEKKIIEGRSGSTLSVFAFGGEASGVSLDGTQYPLVDATLSADFALGVSNKIIDDTATVAVTHGRLLLMVSR